MRPRALLLAAAFALAPAGATAQAAGMRVRVGATETAVEVSSARGFAALPVSRLSAAGWTVERTPVGALLSGPAGARVELRDGTPFLRWGAAVAQLAYAPYFEGADLFIPLQLVTDLLPDRLPGIFAFDPTAMLLTRRGAPRPEPVPVPARDPADRRVVVIDAGHGGEDPGAVSRSGIREKTVALGVARAMAEELRKSGAFEVVMIRDGDTFVPLWDRGARATSAKGERYGIFVSIHANSAAVRGSPARGFETYFLSEARTEHERRVAAIENAPLGVEAVPGGNTGDLDFILRELKNLDQQHWSSLLAVMVQQEGGRGHPGPDRGVKQAPLAVSTNAIMPAILVEIGYLSHAAEAKLLGEPTFHEAAGKALAQAVIRFFQRYPPGSGGTAGEGR
ncbi:MAG: N-acetylmuramoyl-L-alanine amidase [Gemmatimonadetes bacterium]|nr:N-acetylmuramoyl-L-alanine amidase [Gemmatimonadota bacterium]